jgi:hypothetical protein
VSDSHGYSKALFLGLSKVNSFVAIVESSRGDFMVEDAAIFAGMCATIMTKIYLSFRQSAALPFSDHNSHAHSWCIMLSIQAATTKLPQPV